MRRGPTFAGVVAILMTLAGLGLSGCATDPGGVGGSGPVRTSTGLPYRTTRPVPSLPAGGGWQGPVVPPAPLGPQPAARWRQAAQRWMGTPYLFGGTTRSGIDCSAFAQALYREVVGLHLPRTTLDQWNRGRPVASTSLQPGDLVFFLTSGTGQASHVAVFLEGQDFVHAGTRTGVTTASFREAYWRERFVGARRFLAPPAGGAAAGSPTGTTGVRR